MDLSVKQHDVWRKVLELQAPDGSFSQFTQPAGSKAWDSTSTSSPFLTAWIVSLISVQDIQAKSHAIAQSIRQRAVDWLASQHDTHWRWNYWPRNSEQVRLRPYPCDLDTTSCCASALQETQPELITGEVLAHLVQSFALQESSEGGPYRTWFVPAQAPDFYQDVDVAVNANAAFFWQHYELVLPNLVLFLEKALSKTPQPLSSPYYVGPYPVLFFISRVAEQLDSGLWERCLLSHLEISPPKNQIELLLAAHCLQVTSAALQQNKVVKKVLKKARGLEESVITWAPVIKEPLLNKEAGETGSLALSLVLYATLPQFKMAVRALSSQQKKVKQLHRKLVSRVEQDLNSFANSLPQPLLLQCQKVLDGLSSSGEVAKMAIFPSLLQPFLQGKQVPFATLTLLGLTTAYGWLAYTLYDDILDGDSDLNLLGLANVTLRRITVCTDRLSKRQPDLASFFEKTLDAIDAANTWEFQHCRFTAQDPASTPLPDFSSLECLAQKSFGHALGPLSLFFFSGHKVESEEFQNFSKFWRHYLIAKQLNDDAHDWQEDWTSGRHTPVTAQLFSLYQNETRDWGKLSSENWVRSMTEIFLQRELLTWCNQVEYHLVLAHQASEKISSWVQPTYFEEILKPLQQAVELSRQQQQQSQEFVAAFHEHESLSESRLAVA